MARITIFQNRGFTLSKRESHDSEKFGGGKRGKLDGSASSASFRRLRDFCMKMYVPGAECLGITLTIPVLEIVSHEHVKSMWHKVTAWANKHGFPIVWRVELQQRGQAHFHLVLYGTMEQALLLFDEWYRVLDMEQAEIVDGDIVKVPAPFVKGANYACMVERLDGSHRAFRYLVSHASKGKQSQLGFVGRQWGVLCRARFSVVSGVGMDLSDDEYYWILRRLRRLTRSRINSARGCSSWLCNPETVKRMIYFLHDCDKSSMI